LLSLLKKGGAAQVNSIARGNRGRRRTKMWGYPAASNGSDARRGRQDLLTMKPSAMLDALTDLTNRGELVRDPFLRSGSVLSAAQNTGRMCCGVERDPF
jgi:hypothetical protein